MKDSTGVVLATIRDCGSKRRVPAGGEENYEQELQEIIVSIDADHVANDSLFSWRYRLPIFLAVSIGMFNQLSGINAILYYLNDIFVFAGFHKVSSDLQPWPLARRT